MEKLSKNNESNELNSNLNTSKININQGIKLIEIYPENLSLYLNMIGGHSFLLFIQKSI